MILWKRKLYRIILGGLVPFVYLLTKDPLAPALITSFFLFWLLLMEFERYLHPGFWAWLLKHSPGIFKTRPGVLTGDTNFMIASFISVLYFPFPISVANLFFLTFGDAASAMIGSRFGRLHIFPGKTVEGMLGGIAINTVIGILFTFHFAVPFEILFAGVLAGSIIEVLPIKIDDNLTVGIVPGILMTLLFIF
ncbi:MAG: phosphatidate cytidylyltransferase [Candidatus Omnitrophica bacterium]|nr:phosphatidate cytidylyltransferase [Candidatus Omnitrophota bacterium]